MGTINTYLLKVIVFPFVGFLHAQGNAKNSNHLSSFKMIEGNAILKEMVSQINLNEGYNYRESLRKARISNTIYHFDDSIFSEVEILKYFKKAARKSASLEEFASYFSTRDLPFIKGLDHQMVSALYVKIRKTTLNGYLELLDTALTSIYIIE